VELFYRNVLCWRVFYSACSDGVSGGERILRYAKVAVPDVAAAADACARRSAALSAAHALRASAAGAVHTSAYYSGLSGRAASVGRAGHCMRTCGGALAANAARTSSATFATGVKPPAGRG